MLMKLLLLAIASFAVVRYKKTKLIKIVGEPTVAYSIGILLNLTGLLFAEKTFDDLLNISALLIIPLMTINSDLKSLLKYGKIYLKAFGISIFAIILATIISYFLFDYSPELGKISAMLVGIYTGGTPNLISIGKAVNVSEKYFVLINTADIIVGGIYLMFMFSFLPFILEKIWRKKTHSTIEIKATPLENSLTLKTFLFSLIVSIAIVGISLLGVFIIFGGIKENTTPYLMLFISILSVIPAYFYEKTHKFLEGSLKIGNFFIVLFCILLGNKIQITELSGEFLPVLFHCAVVMLLSIVIFYAVSYFVGISYKRALLVDTAAVYSPPFVPVVAVRIGMEQEAVLGILTGVLGYIAGNILGILVNVLFVFLL